jgi:hypothetical protein
MTATRPSTTDILMHMVVTFLTPMFLATSGGNLDQARTAAIQTVSACLTRNPMDLLLVGQMIALGLATLSSVSLSMAENIPITLAIRLRGNAVSLHRASEKCRRALPEPAHQEAPLSDIDLAEEQRIIAEVAETRKRVDAYRASFAQPQTAPTHSTPTTPEFDPSFLPDAPESFDAMQAAMARLVTDAERRTGEVEATTIPTPPAAPHGATHGEKLAYASWLIAMPGVPFPGFDYSVDLPPAEPRAGSMRAAALSTTANHLINGTAPPPR